MSRENWTHKGSFITKTLSAIVITCALAAFQTAPAAAQSATKLDCKECVKSKQLKDGGIKGKDLKDNTIDGSKIEDGAVGNLDLSGDAVTSDKIADGTVEGADLAGNSVSSTDSSNEPGVEYADSNNPNFTKINANGKTVISVQVTAPSDGYVTVVASGNLARDSVDLTATCSIANSNTTDVNPFDGVYARLTTTSIVVPFSTVMTFSQSTGTVRYRLNCITDGGAADVAFESITAMFFPTRY